MMGPIYKEKAANKCPAHMASPSELFKKHPRWILHEVC